MSLPFKNLLLNLLYYAITVVAGPVGVLALEQHFASLRSPSLWLKLLGALLVLGAALEQLWCIFLLQRRGGGTPSPVAPPKQLVTHGPYGWVRNPLNLAEVALLFGLAAWFASSGLLCYALAAWLLFHWFVVAYEEPRHRRVFGDLYARYAARVPRWLPKRPCALGPLPAA